MEKKETFINAPRLPAAQLIFMEQHYKCGTLSNVQIGKGIGKSEAFVRKWAKIMGWEKNLHTRVMDAAARKLAYNADPNRDSHDSFESSAVDMASDMVANVVREQRGVLHQARKLAEQFVAELRILSDFPEEMDRVAEVVAIAETCSEEEATKKLHVFRKILNLDGRTKTLTNLAMALARLIEAERKAFNMDGELGQPPGGSGTGVAAEDLLSAILARRAAEME